MDVSIDIAVQVVPSLAYLGLLGGVVGSLIPPWVNWGIELRREKMKYRRELIRVPDKSNHR